MQKIRYRSKRNNTGFCLFSANDICKRSHIKGLQVSSRFVNAQKIAHISLIAACAAARRAMGTRNGLQET